MTNPYVYTREITDPQVFAGRREELATIETEIVNLVEGQPMKSIALVGVRRVGKTSTLLRASETCKRHMVMPVIMEVKTAQSTDPWFFWFELFSCIISSARDAGILNSDPGSPLKFMLADTSQADQETFGECHLLFEEAYESRLKGTAPPTPPSNLLRTDLDCLLDRVVKPKGYKGLVLMFDEAQRLQHKVESTSIKEMLHETLTKVERIGLVFAGLDSLGSIFNDDSEPFYLQGHLIPLGNFTLSDDIAACALLPLEDDERKLMSPMTVDYLGLLSQGKPNQIRLICHGIYERYQKGKQKDLELTIDVLDDLIEIMEKDVSVTEPLRDKVDAIKALDSVHLEILFNMTRFPNWFATDVVDLDECFRGEARSEAAIERRQRTLERKREYFVSKGLMAEEADKYVLDGDEFVHLYLRFWYEVRKYGRLSRSVVLGKGPQVPFGEKAHKLANAVSWELGGKSGIGMFIFHPDTRDQGQAIVDRVVRRFRTFENLKEKKVDALDKDGLADELIECFEVFKLVKKPGKYILVCLAVRNRDNPRELMQIELYYDTEETTVADLNFESLNTQAEHARVRIDGWAMTSIELLDLATLLENAGTSLEDVLKQADHMGRWLINSLQHLLGRRDEEVVSEDQQDPELAEGKWIELYSKEKTPDALTYLDQKIALSSDRQAQARFFNDRGYIKSDIKGKVTDARRDLELALDYHYRNITLSILNLSWLDMVDGHYDVAIERIEDALLLTHGRAEIEASYLRTLLPTGPVQMKVKWEHRPANILDVAYTNLAYATLKIENGGFRKALEVLEEGLGLLPSSIRLRHALARLYFSNKQAPEATPYYLELSKARISDHALRYEVEQFLKMAPRLPRKTSNR